MNNIFFRVLLAIYAFCWTIASLFAITIALKPDVFNWLSYYISDVILRSPGTKFAMLLISFIFFILSLTFLFSGFRSDKDKKAVSKHTNIGEIKISLNSLENIALTASRRLSGVKDTKAYIYKRDGNVSIVIKAVVLADINIPLLSEDIQVKVKKSVEESTGIVVEEVKVVVENIYTGYKSRVE
jgi:uncharacterized alkaline shock family protein YloU